jgi:hypothetical protein
VIGGYAQKNGLKYASREEKYDGEARRVSMELASAYADGAPIRSIVRTSQFLGSALTVTDTLSLSERATVQFRFLTVEKPTLLSEGRLSLPEGMTLSFDPALSFEAVRVETENYSPQGAFGTDALWQIRLSAEIEEGNFVFLIS